MMDLLRRIVRDEVESGVWSGRAFAWSLRLLILSLGLWLFRAAGFSW